MQHVFNLKMPLLALLFFRVPIILELTNHKIILINFEAVSNSQCYLKIYCSSLELWLVLWDYFGLLCVVFEGFCVPAWVQCVPWWVLATGQDLVGTGRKWSGEAASGTVALPGPLLSAHSTGSPADKSHGSGRISWQMLRKRGQQ